LIWEYAELPNSINVNVLKEKNITILLNKVAIEIDGDTYNVSSLTVKDNKTNNIEKILTEYIFVNRGYSSSISFIEGLNITNNGIIEVNENKATKEEGIFAAGDVSKNDNKQIITAINDGAIAAMNAIKYVNKK
jgi:thioredoxin reductase (NADPH)